MVTNAARTPRTNHFNAPRHTTAFMSGQSVSEVAYYFAQLDKPQHQPQTREEEDAMFVGYESKAPKEKKVIQEKLVNRNLRFAVSIAAEYQNRGIDLPDLIQYANIGLITASKRFDHTLGNRFISYAVWWVRQSIHGALTNDARVFRIPSNVSRIESSVARAQASFYTQHGRYPDGDELVAETGLTQNQVETGFLGFAGFRSVSLTYKAGEGEGRGWTFEEKIADTNLRPDEACENQDRQEKVERLLATLDEREADIVRRYFGMDGKKDENLKKLGTAMGLTRERIRQIKAVALRKLKHPKRLKLLQELAGVDA